jgi:hypothetical protein
VKHVLQLLFGTKKGKCNISALTGFAGNIQEGLAIK